MGKNNWFVFAGEDQQIAESALKDKIYNQICFHSQQGVEKLLKGFLRAKKEIFPKTHSLAEVLRLCERIDSTFSCLERECLTLDKYYIITRYPDALPGTLAQGLPVRKQAQEALSILRKVNKFVEKKLAQ